MNTQPVIALDAMGSEHAPAPEVAGAVDAARRFGVGVTLVGDQDRIEAELAKHNIDGLNLSVCHCTEVVGMKDSASDAIRKKKDSSIRITFEQVKAGKAIAAVSAGNSGATMAAAMFILKRVPGVERPAIATLMPNQKGLTLILDAGANVDCKPQHLFQFGVMGELYARKVMGLSSPRVSLLSNGEEESKGNELTRDAHQLLKEAPFAYSGYCEGRDIFNGEFDVVVCDGFVGNVILKSAEGMAEAIASLLRDQIKSRFWAKIGFLLARPAFAAFKKQIDYAEYGGAPLLGVNGAGVICHGGSNAKAIMNAIRVANEFAREQVVDDLAEQLTRIEEAKTASANN